MRSLSIYFILIHFILIVTHFLLHTVRLLRMGMDYRVCIADVSFNYFAVTAVAHDNRQSAN